MIERDRGRHPQAETLFLRTLALLEASVEPGHPELVGIRADYAVLLRATGRDAEAAALEEPAASADQADLIETMR